MTSKLIRCVFEHFIQTETYRKLGAQSRQVSTDKALKCNEYPCGML